MKSKTIVFAATLLTASLFPSETAVQGSHYYPEPKPFVQQVEISEGSSAHDGLKKILSTHPSCVNRSAASESIDDLVCSKENLREDASYFMLDGQIIASENELVYPVPDWEGRIISDFGGRKDPFTQKKKFHYGVDIKGRYGEPVMAVSSGIVAFSGWMRGYGKTVIVTHDKYSALYAHGSRLIARTGQRVEEGDIIMKMGHSGRAEADHLHLEIRNNGFPINPVSNESYKNVLMRGYSDAYARR